MKIIYNRIAGIVSLIICILCIITIPRDPFMFGVLAFINAASAFMNLTVGGKCEKNK